MGAVRAGNADGAHLNFEVFGAVDPAAREGLTDFVRSLSSALKAYRNDAELTIFLPGYDHGESYDELALSRIADGLIVQGYDMHWLDGPTAGPVAPITGWEGANWSGILDRYLSLGVAPEQIVMTVPYFGYEWPTAGSEPGSATRGVGVPITYAPVDPDLLPLIRVSATARAAGLEVFRDPVSDSPYYRYRGEDGWYQGWYEDGRSLAAKYRLAKTRGLGGVAIFLLGYDGQRLESELRRAFR
jgi:di-N-acetylchitobiase